MAEQAHPSRIELSDRGRALVENPPFPEYLQEHFVRVAEPYEAASRPEGYIDLCVAENRLVWDLLEPRFNAERNVPHSALCYDNMTGSDLFRQQIATFLGRTCLGRTFQPEQLVVLGGAGSILETMFYAMANPGEGVLVPTPSYAGFWADIETRDALRIVPVHTRSEDGFRLTPSLLDEACAQSSCAIRALLFTTPNNPLGTVYTPDEVTEVVAWAAERGVHVIFDEVYALSVFGAQPFVSVANVMPALGDNVHIVWSFSKDFAASGLRCGVLISENERLLEAVGALSYWACCSGDTQSILGHMISDTAWVDAYIAESNRRLASACESAKTTLESYGVPVLNSEAGFFFLADFRAFLDAQTREGERALWLRFINEANVNFTPGAACRIHEPGFMRVCFGAQSESATRIAFERVGAVLKA